MPRPVSNPPNPWETIHAEWLGEPPPAELEVFEEEAKSIITENDSPDVGFRFGVNPYRGCFHSCSYCYARPTHQYLGWGAGTDFDRKIVAKVNAPVLLREEMSRKSWKGDTIVFSGITDCYQPIEATYALTRRCLEICAEFRNPVGIVTKGALIRRDVDVLARLAEEADVGVWISTPFLDDATGRAIEPGASLPSQRFETMRLLAARGDPRRRGDRSRHPGPERQPHRRDPRARAGRRGAARLPAARPAAGGGPAGLRGAPRPGLPAAGRRRSGRRSSRSAAASGTTAASACG